MYCQPWLLILVIFCVSRPVPTSPKRKLTCSASNESPPCDKLKFRIAALPCICQEPCFTVIFTLNPLSPLSFTGLLISSCRGRTGRRRATGICVPTTLKFAEVNSPCLFFSAVPRSRHCDIVALFLSWANDVFPAAVCNLKLNGLPFGHCASPSSASSTTFPCGTASASIMLRMLMWSALIFHAIVFSGSSGELFLSVALSGSACMALSVLPVCSISLESTISILDAWSRFLSVSILALA